MGIEIELVEHSSWDSNLPPDPESRNSKFYSNSNVLSQLGDCLKSRTLRYFKMLNLVHRNLFSIVGYINFIYSNQLKFEERFQVNLCFTKYFQQVHYE